MNLVIGKFYPPHEGHHWLIEQAMKDNRKGDRTVVVIMWSETESIRPGLRKNWLIDAHGFDLTYVIVRDELPVNFNDPELSNRHAALIERALYPYFNISNVTKVFGCEPYVEHLAEYFKAEPVRLDRSHIHISSTQIREDPREYWDYLRPATRAGLCKRVVCIGAESCGTTTLARDLAEHYETPWVPEYGRTFSEGLGFSPWDRHMFAHIELMQKEMENEFARTSENGILICDTNTLATQVWEEFLLGPSKIRASAADLYILTALCPWTDDGTRTGASFQRDMQQRFGQKLTGPHSKYNVCFVTGSREERIATAVRAIDALTWQFNDPKG